RATFGVFGANVPALLRGLVAIFWYGIQTYLASTAVIVLLLRLDPELRSWTEPTFLGLHALGWAAFLTLWTVQLLILNYGMEIVRRYERASTVAVGGGG
ncbi:cytosine permease, partial [Enterococcus faecalis]|uniref:cytosine permease n=1 Tax=Enterococcus faecalis TaxID=1351 RepID=UPI0022A80886